MKLQEDGLKREIGIWGLSANMINIIIGSGIFVLPSIVAGILGPASIIAYIFCGTLAMFIMLCFAEMGSKITKSGGDYTYVETVFGKYPGFLIFMIGFVSRVCGTAAVANALVDTLAVVVPVFHSYTIKIIFFTIIFFGFATINVLGVKQGIALVKFNTMAKLLPLILLIIFGLNFINIDNLKWTATPHFKQIGDASLILFFAYTGGPTGLLVGGEIKNPNRTVPRAIIASMIFLVFFYMAIQTVSQGVFGSQLSLQTATPLANVGQVIFGSIGFTIIILGTSISMFGNISGQTLNTPRSLFAVSRDGVLPIKAFQKIHKKYATPYISILTFSTLAFVFAILGGFKTLAIFTVAGALLTYASVSIAVLKFRKINVLNKKEFTIPGGAIIPSLSIITCLFFLYHLKKNAIINITIFIGITSLLYWSLNWFKQKNKD